MKKLICAVTILPVLLAGCGGVNFSDADTREALKVAAIAYIQNLKRAGIDPLKLDDRQVAIVSANCAVATVVAGVVAPEVGNVSTPEVVADFCEVFLASQEEVDS